MNENLMKLLYESLDNKLSADDQIILDKALGSDAELREEKEKAVELRKLLQENKTERFDNNFIRDLMVVINNEKDTASPSFVDSEILLQYFRPVAAIAALLILVTVGYNLKSSDEITFYSALAIEEDSIENLFDENLNFDSE